ncbi:MAG TPA: DUF2157 domain-containing protein [Duganella sp.]|nr:DUF2157 domain-containing protein [Duganella sp.]
MNLRVAILALVEKHNLSADAGRRLKQLATLDAPPPSLLLRLPFGLAVLAAVLVGLGLLFWVAANWDALPRSARFILLQAIVLATLSGAWRLPRARVQLSLSGFLACGGLFAYFGQTYQTGADPWQLFALWATLTLPLCLGVRHDVLWVPWTIVALTAAQLFSQVRTNGWWWDSDISLQSSLGSWVPALVLAFLFKFAPRAWDGVGTGAGRWPMRLSMIYAIIGLATMSVRSLFSTTDNGFYPISLLIVLALGFAFSRRGLFDIFVLSALGLGANVLAVCGMTQLLLGVRGDEIAALLLIGCVSAGMLAGTVKLIVHLARVQTGEHIL